MNSTIISNIFRFAGLFLLQVLVLKQIFTGIPSFNYVHILLYPLCIILLPIRTSGVVMLIIAFVFGMLVDVFYDSIGIHTSALLVTAYIRSFILSLYEPREGYNVSHSPTKRQYGDVWFLKYSATLIAIHAFIYFSVEAFTFAYIVDILLRTIFSSLASMIFVVFYVYLFNPKE